jgi:Right handed beta helix region
LTRPVVLILEASVHETCNAFTIRGVAGEENGPGMLTGRDHSGHLIRDTIFEDNGVGLRLGSNGAHPTLVCRNRFAANNEFADGGFGVFSDEGARQVLITYNRFERHNGAGIFFADRGATQRDVLIDHNKSVDDLSFATIYGSSRVRLSANNVRARVGDPAFPGPARRSSSAPATTTSWCTRTRSGRPAATAST